MTQVFMKRKTKSILKCRRKNEVTGEQRTLSVHVLMENNKVQLKDEDRREKKTEQSKKNNN